ncbi:MAG: hypothetical protein NVS3B25_07240 [Hymenobacter sp.]
MNLPDEQRLDDAQWQLDHATGLVAPLLAHLQARPEPADPAGRVAYEQDQALLRALRYYFTSVGNRLELLDQVFAEMDAEMHAANGRYRSLRLAHDFALHEAREANRRYYAENDTFNFLLQRLAPSNRVQ